MKTLLKIEWKRSSTKRSEIQRIQERRGFYLFLSSVNYRKIQSIHLKISRFVEDVLFYSKNDVMAFPKLE